MSRLSRHAVNGNRRVDVTQQDVQNAMQGTRDIFERFGLWLQTKWNRPLACMLGIHNEMSTLTPGRVFLKCQDCGHETGGWELDRPRYVVK